MFLSLFEREWELWWERREHCSQAPPRSWSATQNCQSDPASWSELFLWRKGKKIYDSQLILSSSTDGQLLKFIHSIFASRSTSLVPRFIPSFSVLHTRVGFCVLLSTSQGFKHNDMLIDFCMTSATLFPINLPRTIPHCPYRNLLAIGHNCYN